MLTTGMVPIKGGKGRSCNRGNPGPPSARGFALVRRTRRRSSRISAPRRVYELGFVMMGLPARMLVVVGVLRPKYTIARSYLELAMSGSTGYCRALGDHPSAVTFNAEVCSGIAATWLVSGRVQC